MTKPTIDLHVTSKDSDQPVHPPSMARVLVHPSLDSLEAVEGLGISEDSDQTADAHADLPSLVAQVLL